MNLSLSSVLYFCLFFKLVHSTSSYARQALRIETKTGFIEIIPKNETHTTSTTSSTTTRTTTRTTASTTARTTAGLLQKIDEKEIKTLLLKMLTIATAAKQNETAKNTEIQTTERSTTTTTTNVLGFKKIISNKPQKYDGSNKTISGLCPYFISHKSFKMEKMAGVYWPRFYNMKDPLKCFKIDVIKLSDKQMKDNEWTFGTFGGKINWREGHFEIKPPKTMNKVRHFLLGDSNSMGVMRNIMITRNANDEFILQEDAPDQWLMLRNVVVLRDCMTGEVVVFTKSPQQTSTAEVVEVLQDLGEEMTGQMVCDEDDDWLRDYYV